MRDGEEFDEENKENRSTTIFVSLIIMRLNMKDGCNLVLSGFRTMSSVQLHVRRDEVTR